MRQTLNIKQSSLPLNPARFALLRELSSFNVASSSLQGVAFDDTHVYVSENQVLYKYTKAGALVTSRNVGSDGSTTVHVGGIYVKDGKIYGATANYPTIPRQGHIVRWDATTLAFEQEWVASADNKHTGAITYHDGSWWVQMYDSTVRQFDESFNIIATYDVPFTFETAPYNFDGMAWVGNTLIMNPHEGNVPAAAQQFYFDGNEFIHVGTIEVPNDCTQGMMWDEANQIMYMGRRSSTDQVVTARLEVNDFRYNNLAYAFESTERTTTSTGYVEDLNLVVSIRAKKGDIIRVDLQGLFNVSANSLRAYVDLASTNTTAATRYIAGPSIRTNATFAEKQTHGATNYYVADADGVLQFSRRLRIVTSGTARMADCYMTAQIIGRYRD